MTNTTLTSTDPTHAGITTILWDCDGVLQHGRHDWATELDRRGGPGFGQALFAAEVPALEGRRPLVEVIEDLLLERRSELSLSDVLGLWDEFDADEDAWQLLDECRATGLTCVLATNQQDLRVQLMRSRGFDDRVDAAYYSCELGVMKPEAGFFTAILDDLAVRPEQALFIDDSARNVAAARALGLRVIHHDPAAGAAALRQELSEILGATGLLPGA